jgi:hypothetical protein
MGKLATSGHGRLAVLGHGRLAASGHGRLAARGRRKGPRRAAAAAGALAVTGVAAIMLAACGSTAAPSGSMGQAPGSPGARSPGAGSPGDSSPGAGSPGAGSPPASSAGSGAAQPVPATIAAMQAAVRSARSVRVTGTLSGTGGQTVGLDIGLIRSGGFSGTVTQGGVPEMIIDAGGTVYIKATQAFLAQLNVPAAVCSVMCGKYVAMSGAKGDALAGQLSMSQMMRSFTATLPAFTRAGTRTINGQQAQVLRGADGSTLALAAAGRPLPVEVISPPGHRGRVSFSQWNMVPRPVAPPARDVISLSQLGG